MPQRRIILPTMNVYNELIHFMTDNYTKLNNDIGLINFADYDNRVIYTILNPGNEFINFIQDKLLIAQELNEVPSSF